MYLTKCLPTVKCLCYSTLVRPIIEYACTVWSSYHQQNVAIEIRNGAAVGCQICDK